MLALHLEDSLSMDMAAYGVLSTMLNVPEFDNVTIEKLSEASSDSEDVVRNAIDLLIEKGYVIKTKENKYCVDKEKILEMKKV